MITRFQLFSFDLVPSTYMEEVGLMTYTTASHQGGDHFGFTSGNLSSLYTVNSIN